MRWTRSLSLQVRLLLGVGAGALVGEYLALEVVPAQLVLQVCVCDSVCGGRGAEKPLPDGGLAGALVA